MDIRRKALVNLLGSALLLIPCCAVLFYQSLPFVANSWAVLEGSQDGGGLEAVYLLKTAIPLCFVLLFLQALAIIHRSAQILRTQ